MGSLSHRPKTSYLYTIERIMNYSSPFGKDWKVKKDASAVANAPPEKFKPEKPKLSTKTGKELVEHSCSPTELMWIERWLDNLVRSRSLPPQCCGKDAFGALTKFLAPQSVLEILEQLRKDFASAHPSRSKEVEDFGFLLEVLGGTNAHQSLPLPYDRSSPKEADDL
jgi:hypothetical protein